MKPTKRCTDCGFEKLRTDYYSGGRGRIQPFCKSCANIRASQKKKNWLIRIKANPERHVAHLEKQRQARIRFYNTEYGKASMISAANKRKENMAQIETGFSKEDVAFIYRQFNYRCFKCGSNKHRQIDHHYPLSKGFALTRDNAVLLCRSCNGSGGKGTKMPEEFYSPWQMIELATMYEKRYILYHFNDIGMVYE